MKENIISDRQVARNSSVELLRILLICAVTILHYVSNPGQLLISVKPWSTNFYIVVFLNSLSVCAVDTFIVITGYFGCKSTKISIRKIIQLLIQVIVFQIITSTVSAIIEGKGISARMIVGSIIPKNYYITLYCALIAISPFINSLLGRLSEKDFKRLVLVLSIVFLLEPLVVEILEGVKGDSINGISTVGLFGAQSGYTIVTFVCIYTIAAYTRFYGCLWNQKFSLAIWAISSGGLFIWKLVEIKFGRSISAESYMNPLVVINALSLFDVFRRKTIESVFINRISRGCLTVYLLNGFLIPLFSLTNFLNRNPAVFTIALLTGVIVVFAVGDSIGVLYSVVEKKLFDLFGKNRDYYSISCE